MSAAGCLAASCLTAIVNGGETPERRAATAPLVADLRAHYAAAGATLDPPPGLREVLEGPAPLFDFALDLESAKQAYARFEYRRAEAHLDAEITRTLWAAPPDRIRPTLAELYIWRGVVAIAAGRSAYREFITARRLDPSRRLDPARFPPPAIAAFADAAREAVLDASIELWVDPPGAQRVVVGMHPGTALIIVEKPRFRRLARIVRAPRLEVALDRAPPAEAARDAMYAAVAHPPGSSGRLAALEPLPKQLGVDCVAVVEPNDNEVRQLRLYIMSEGAIPPPRMLSPGHPEQVAGMLRTGPPQRPGPTVAGTPWYERWWVWTVVGAAVAGSAAAAIAIASAEDTVPSPTLSCCGP